MAEAIPKPGCSSQNKSDLSCSACHVLKPKLRAWRWISTHYHSSFDLNANQSDFNYHNDELLQVWGKNWWLWKMSTVYEAPCLGFNDSLIGIMSQTSFWLDQTFLWTFTQQKPGPGHLLKIMMWGSKVAFMVMPQHSFPLTGRMFFLMRDDLASRRGFLKFLVTNVRNHGEALVCWKKIL